VSSNFLSSKKGFFLG